MKSINKILTLAMTFFLFSGNPYLYAHKKKVNSVQENISELQILLKKDPRIDKLLENFDLKKHENVVRRFRNSAEKRTMNFEEYKKKIGYEGKRKKINEFIQKNKDVLNAAQKKYGMPVEVIAAILGIESNFGKVTGKYNPFYSYVSIYAQNYRKNFAKSQLEELLAFCKPKNCDIEELKSSYAGAMGYAQFIPSSLNKWFVGNDLYSMKNNIFSIGNYLSHFKKERGSLKKAIHAYNPSELYVRAVMSLAEEVK